MPVVWGLTGDRVGDNQQVMHFAAALGYELREVKLAYGPLRVLPNWLLGASRASLTSMAANEILPPWPDLIVGTGQRSVPVARWVQKQSGGKTKLVFLGRPRAPLDWFDLVVTTPQYGLPAQDNVMTVALPYVEHQLVPISAGAWLGKWRTLPRPLTAVLVGGSSQPYKINANSIKRLVELAREKTDGGTLIFTTSPRTPQAATSQLIEAAAGYGEMCLWAPGADNPYPALLAEADRFIVTEDSVTMISEAVATGKSVTVAPVAQRLSISWRADRGLGRRLARSGVLSPPRNVRRLVRMLAANGTVTMAGKIRPVKDAPELSTWAEALTRLRRMVG